MVTDPAAVVVVGDIQALMQTALNAPGVPIQTYPVYGIQARGLEAADQRHQFIFATFGLTQQQGRLLGQWEADLFSADWRGNNSAAFFAALVDFLRISLSRRRLLRGKKPPAGW